jgi:hypothetical protein
MEKDNENTRVASYLKTDNNKIINETHIRWVKKMTKSTGCSINGDTHRICKLNSPDSYDKLNVHF